MFRNSTRAFILCASLVAALLSSAQFPAAAAAKPVAGTSITNDAGVGTTIKVTPSTWASAVAKRSYQWLLNSKPIPGKTASSIKLASSHLAKRISVRETVTFKNRSKATSVSNTLKVGQIKYSGLAILSHPDGDKTKLRITAPAVLTPKVTLSYSWQRGVVDLDATSADYAVTMDDYGASMTGAVTLKAKGYSTLQIFTNAVAVTGGVTPGPGVKTLVWSQEFNGSSGVNADSNAWSNDIGDGCAMGNCGWGNNEKQWYTADASKQDGNGNLVITATKGSGGQTCYYGVCSWTSAKLTTKGKLGFKYGYLEARIKGPVGKGTWPAFWALGANYREAPGQSTPWPACGEIDIFETTGDFPKRNFGTLHSPGRHGGGTVDLQVGTGEDYHTYAINWSPNRIEWFVDGIKFHEATKASFGADPWPFNAEFYIILNVAMGGWGGEPAANLTTANMSVDWIRFSSVDGVGELIRK